MAMQRPPSPVPSNSRNDRPWTSATAAPLRPEEIHSPHESLSAFWKYETTESYIPNNGGCRDFCANERTFLSYIRLSLTLAVLAFALLGKIRLSSSPAPPSSKYSRLESAAALPLGIIFTVLALGTLGVGSKVYWTGIRGLRDGVGFIGAGRLGLAYMIVMSLTLLAAIAIILAARPEKF